LGIRSWIGPVQSYLNRVAEMSNTMVSFFLGKTRFFDDQVRD
jgi:hypothetical protein